MREDQPRRVKEAIARLKSFHDGESALADVIGCGKVAIPELRTMLFERETSGLYQARCRAVEALAELGAYDVLIEFLRAQRTITDPVERIGEDAVINAAAMALPNVREQPVFDLLLQLAQRPALNGVIGALGKSGRVEAIPVLINALEEDFSRFAAEIALKKLGRAAVPALRRTLDRHVPSEQQESESSARRRRSALRLVMEMDGSQDLPSGLSQLMHDKDAKVAVLACEACFAHGSTAERHAAVSRMIELLAQDDWLLREEIENCLVVYFDAAREAIADYRAKMSRATGGAVMERTEAILRRIVTRGQAPA